MENNDQIYHQAINTVTNNAHIQNTEIKLSKYEEDISMILILFQKQSELMKQQNQVMKDTVEFFKVSVDKLMEVLSD